MKYWKALVDSSMKHFHPPLIICEIETIQNANLWWSGKHYYRVFSRDYPFQDDERKGLMDTFSTLRGGSFDIA